MKEIQFRQAKATLSAVIDDARRGEPSLITRHGRPEAVVLSFEEWQRTARLRSFGAFLMSAPFQDGDIPERDPSPMRDVDL